MLPADDGIHSYELKDRYITYPNVVNHKNRKKGKYLGIDFEGYRSDNNKDWLTVERLKKMIKELE